MPAAPTLSVVVPTLNEAGNVGEVVRRLEEGLAEISHEILVVDDGSIDGTRDEARSAGRNVHVIHRTKDRGLSSAVLEGFEAARGDYVCVMDGDLQHPPEAVEDLLSTAEWSGADAVVGSRFTPAGQVEGFPLHRRLVSEGARRLTQLASPTVRRHGLTDPISGFFLVRRDRLDLEAIEPRGYKILLEVLHKCPLDEVREVGFTFQNRTLGESNLTPDTAWTFLEQLGSLAARERSNRRLTQFALVGLTGIVVNLSLLASLTELAGLHYLVSAAIAIEASILSNFGLNDVWTFRDRRRDRWWSRLWRFNVVSLMALLVNLAVLSALTEGAGVHYLISEVAAIGASFATNYKGNLSWTYVTTDLDEVEDRRQAPLVLRGVDRVRQAIAKVRGQPSNAGEIEGQEDEPG